MTSPAAARQPPIIVPGLSVVMSAFNEESVIEDALKSAVGLARELVVVDCSSADDTAAIAVRYAQIVLSEPNRLMLNINKNVAIDAATSEWILLIDPDERISPQLAGEIRAIVEGDARHDAYWMPRKNYELGVWITTMGKYPGSQLRLFRNGSARFACRDIHEMVTVNGTVGRLRGDLLHLPPQDLYTYVHKRNLYSEHRARFLHDNGRKPRLYNLIWLPVKAFVREYVLRRGWADGRAGFIIAVIGSFGFFIQQAKLWQLHQSGGKLGGAQAPKRRVPVRRP